MRLRGAARLAAVSLLVTAAAGRAGALDAGVHGYAQIWATVYDQLQNGVRQAQTSDVAQQAASGMSLRRARVSMEDTLGRASLRWRTEVLLEKSARLTDCYVAARLGRDLELQVGQMKIPSVYEVATPSSQLDFVEPVTIAEEAVDWSLSRTPYISSFMSNAAYQRDAGVALRGRSGPLRWRGMVSNGLGAGLFVGGSQHREYVLTNGVGHWFYGLRLDLQVLPWLALGGHGSWNRHDGVLFNDQRTVLDLNRRSASADALARLPGRVHVRGLWAAGVVDDDFFHDGKTNYEYSGYELKAMWWTVPERLETGVRFDRYTDEANQTGDRVVQDTWTVGANLSWGPQVRLQPNYVLRRTDRRYERDPHDDAFVVNLQASF